MCGRAAQTHHAYLSAASPLVQGGAPPSSGSNGTASTRSETTAKQVSSEDTSTTTSEGILSKDNFNMSPGMDAFIFVRDPHSANAASVTSVKLLQSTWGLVPRAGSARNPIPEGMSKHFNNLMFNARSDTLFEKPTFSRLAHEGRSCLIAVDGFFEWKPDPLGGSSQSKKQPYYVHGKNQPFLLMPGLWTCVKTGRTEEGTTKEETLHTFTIITTDACPALQWLHTRMPICLWDIDLGKQWIERPTEEILREMENHTAARSNDNVLSWYPVTKSMSSLKFRGEESIRRVQQPKSVKDFFTVKKKAPEKLKSDGSGMKRPASTVVNKSPFHTPKKIQKGQINSYFSPKTT